MSSVFADGPRRGAASNLIPSKIQSKSERNAQRRAQTEKLRLVGASDASAESTAGLRGAASLLQLGGSPLLLYLATAIVVVATGVWVVSDISRRRQPLDRSTLSASFAPSASETASATPAEPPALLPPARLGDGVVAPPEAPTTGAPSPAETLNALMRQSDAPVAPPAPAVEPMQVAQQPAAAPVEPAPPQTSSAMAVAVPSAPPTTSVDPVATPTLSEQTPAPAATFEPRKAPALAKCLLKVDGKVLFQRGCSAERAGTRTVLKLGDKTLTVALMRGETWQATFGGKSLGNVYRTDGCWGRKKQVYICAE